MDEEEDRDFSKSIVFGFLEQAETTFVKMESEMYVNLSRHPYLTYVSRANPRHISKDKNLDELSKLGHFLKGSSATLGFVKVRDECEKIQHYGHKKNDTGEVDEPDEDKCLRLINESLAEAKRAYKTVDELMKQYYADSA
jgi:osomolarity two-component system, phosphorelay intermediate protein YPD1